MLSMNLTVRVRRRSSFLSSLTKYIQFQFQSFLKKNYICKIFILRFLQRNFSIFPFDKCDESNSRFGSISMFEFHFRKKKKRNRSQSRHGLWLFPRSTKRLEQVEKLADRNGRRKRVTPISRPICVSTEAIEGKLAADRPRTRPRRRADRRAASVARCFVVVSSNT